MKDKYPKNYLLLMAVSVFCLIAIVFSSSYAYFKARIVNNTNPFELIGGTIKLQLNENSISGEKLLPILDSQKDTNAQIKNFTVKRTDDSNVDVCYNVYLVIESISDNIKNSKYMKYELTNGSSTTTGNFSTVAYQDGKAIILLAQNKYLSKTNTTGDAYTLKIWLSYDGSVDQNSLLGGNFSAHIYAQGNSGNTCPGSIETKYTLYEKLLSDKTTRPDRGSFSSVLTTDNTKTLYTGTENGTTVYYFAGNATDNWVKFGKNASNQDLYWRIIRTNSDGSVRLLYHGTSTTATDAYIGTSKFNTEYNDPMYVGYMYGASNATSIDRSNTNNSTIKGVIDTWYKNNLNTNYGKYISTTAVYCNDRSNPAGGYNTGNTEFYYAARTRLDTNKTPSYDCATAEDKFTADSSTGNGKLKYPIALMTADEVSFAGGLWATNAPTWYYYNSANGSSTGSTWWWLLSPYRWNGNHAYVFRVGGSSYPGYLDGSYVNFAIGARPVISLKSDVLYKTGDGSAESPYEIQETPDTISDVVKANAVNENGYRYEGSDPNNYIQMQKSDGTTEMWRIIGLFPDGESGENVIRVRKVGYESAAYDTNQTNHWPNTTLYTTLSSTYTLVNYKNTVNYKMYLGGSNNLYNYTSANLYDMERMLNSKGEAGKTSSTSYNSATTYVGSVGLMYPSDYGYAVLASDCARTINPSNYSGTSACYTNNWLYQGSSDIQWLISPKPSLVNIACIVNGSGYVLNFNSTAVVTNSGSFSPVMALKSDVVVTGSGTQSDPYIMK